jgi:hypothetical protein
MLSFKINGNGYHSPDWEGVTLLKFLNFLDDVQPLQPECLDGFLFFEEGEEVDLQKRWDEFPVNNKIEALEYFAVEIAYWCDAPKDLIVNSISPDMAFNGWLSLQVQYNPNLFKVDEDFKSFKFRGTTYVLPEKHLRGTTIGEYADAANFQTVAEQLKNGRWKSIADVIAVICRPKGEEYNFEVTHENRSKLFLNLPMDIVINVAFFLLMQNVTSTDTIAIYSLLQAKGRLKHKLTV